MGRTNARLTLCEPRRWYARPFYFLFQTPSIIDAPYSVSRIRSGFESVIKVLNLFTVFCWQSCVSCNKVWCCSLYIAALKQTNRMTSKRIATARSETCACIGWYLKRNALLFTCAHLTHKQWLKEDHIQTPTLLWFILLPFISFVYFKFYIIICVANGQTAN